MRSYVRVLPILLLVTLGACSSDKETKRANAGASRQPDRQRQEKMAVDLSKVSGGTSSVELTYQMSGIPFDLNGAPVSIAGVTFTPASQWTDLGPSDAGQAGYTYGPLDNDADSATLTVSYSPGNGSDSIGACLDRWFDQLWTPDGIDPRQAAIQYKMTVDGMTAHVVSFLGIYRDPVGGPKSRKKLTKENYRLVGVALEAPEGNLFFKLTGPEYTARIMIEAFVTMIKSIKKNR